MNPSNLERAVGSGALLGLVGDTMFANLFASAEGRALAVVVLGAVGGALSKVLAALGDRLAEKIRGRRRKATE